MSVLDPHLSAARDFLWGVAHALDLGATLAEEEAWDGPEADREALAADWRAAFGALQLDAAAGDAGEAE